MEMEVDNLSENDEMESRRRRCTNEGIVIRPSALVVGFEPPTPEKPLPEERDKKLVEMPTLRATEERARE